MHLNSNGILVLTYDEVVFNDSQSMGIMPAGTYKRLRSQGKISASRGGFNNPVEVEYESLPKRYMDKVVETYGNPYDKVQDSFITSQLNPCKEELDKLREVSLDDGAGLAAGVIKKYHAQCQWLDLLVRMKQKGSKAIIKAAGFSTKKEFKAKVAEIVTQPHIGLPPATLERRIRQYEDKGLESVVSGKHFMKNHSKLTQEGLNFLITRYACPVRKPFTSELQLMYNDIAKERGWETISENAIKFHLNKPENKVLWSWGRYGEIWWMNHYGHTNKTIAPSCRDAMWIIDGSKLNFWYQDENGMAAKLKHTILIDAYSEMILGDDVSYSENSVSAYITMKHAANRAGAKPFQILYDGQSGFKKSEVQDFMDRLSRVHYPSRPYNSKSKLVENIIGRLQMQVMRKWWFFTGQNITAKKQDSKVNIDYIMSRKAKLPTLEEVKKVIAMCVQEWNNNRHPHFPDMTREDVYNTSTNPNHVAIEPLDMVDLFWLPRKKGLIFYNDGIHPEINGEELDYMVYGSDNMPDQEFLRKYTGFKFWYKFDPEHLDSILLYTPEDMRFVAEAKSTRRVVRAEMDHTTSSRKDAKALLEVRGEQLKKAKTKLFEMQEADGYNPEEELLKQHRAFTKEENDYEGESIMETVKSSRRSDDWLDRL